MLPFHPHADAGPACKEDSCLRTRSVVSDSTQVRNDSWTGSGESMCFTRSRFSQGFQFCGLIPASRKLFGSSSTCLIPAILSPFNLHITTGPWLPTTPGFTDLLGTATTTKKIATCRCQDR
ncbi:unnamed protein product [Urochloa humidicola]